MRTHARPFAALALVVLTAALIVTPSWAQTPTTYEVTVGADYFESLGVPGFSSRFYPQSITIHKGDTIRFIASTTPIILPEGVVPEEFFEEHFAFIGDSFYIFTPDPDDGSGAVKLNSAIEGAALACGDAATPCEWDGNAADPLIPPFLEELYVTFTGNPGDVIYAASNLSTHFRIEIVADGEPASTQAELDARASTWMTHDADLALSIHNKYSAKQTKHKTAAGVTVWDAWAGVDQGPVSLLAMYPKKMRIKKGQKVQFHFNLQNEIHSVATPVDAAFALGESTFVPQCDPDDSGPGPDTDPTFTDEGEPVCPPGSELELDFDPAGLYESGNGVLTGKSDSEFSGIKFGDRLQDGSFPLTDWTLKYKATSPPNSKGWRYFCTIHGPFMGGFVAVE